MSKGERSFMICASYVRALRKETKDRIVFTLPESLFNAFGPTDEAEALIDRYILLRSGAGYTDVVIGVPCLANHSDVWNFDTATMLGRMCGESEYACSICPTMEHIGPKQFYLLTIRWE